MESESLPLRKRIFSASESLADFSPSRRLISSSKEVPGEALERLLLGSF